MQMKNKLYEIEYIRIICAVGIILYHIACESACIWKPLHEYKNGDWGDVLVTIFFTVSGGVIYINNSSNMSLKKYYAKRFKSIYPMFYLCFLPLFLLNAIKKGSFFYKGDPFLIILSILGIDGYFKYAADNYYIIGEWFLGAIILIYIAYPVMLYFFKRNSSLYLICIALCFIGLNLYDIFMIESFRNIISCMLSFSFGMIMFSKQDLIKSPAIICISVLIASALQIIILPSPIHGNISSHLLGLCLFIILFNFSSILSKYLPTPKAISFLGSLTYPVFLIQHRIINTVLRIFDYTNVVEHIIVSFLIIILCFSVSLILKRICLFLLNSRTYRDLESLFN